MNAKYNKLPAKNRAVIYCRVSSKEQVTEGNSLSSQERICNEYAFRKGYEVVETFLEKGESAKTADRTELDRLLKFCSDKTNQVGVVIFYKVDRWARYSKDYLNLKDWLNNRGIELQSASENLMNTPAGRLLETMLAGQAQFDNEMRTERSTLGMKDALREGRYCWNAPYGYENSRINGRANITIHPIFGPIVKRIFDVVSRNEEPIEETRKKFLKEGMQTEKGRPFPKTSFYTILKNPVYMGEIKAFGETFQGSYEPLISNELFEQVQRVLRLRGKKSAIHITDHPDFPLRRFVRFKATSEKLTGSWSTGRTKKYPFYRFGQSNINLRRDEFNNFFVKFLNKQGMPGRIFPRFLKFVEKQFICSIDEKEKRIETVDNEINELKKRQTLLITKNFEGIINDVVLKQQLELIEGELVELYIEKNSIPYNHKDIHAVLDKIKKYLIEPGYVWDKAPVKSKLSLQWFQFPKGVFFDGRIIGTTDLSCIYKAKKLSLKPESHWGSPAVEFWNQFVSECNRLAGILDEIESEDKTSMAA